jgi:hypothetical protein
MDASTGSRGGIVLHAGQAAVELDAGIAAVPLSAVWTLK